MEYPATEGVPIRSLVLELVRDLGTLCREEMDLAGAELVEKARQARGGATRIGIGIVLGAAGGLALAGAAVLGITLVFLTWLALLPAAALSSLVVGLILAVIAFVLVRQGGKNLSPAHFIPERTLETLKENARWAREQL